jgi:hypothetical protein
MNVRNYVRNAAGGIMIALLMGGCGQTRPTDGEGKAAILSQITKSDEVKAINLLNYRKTNGIPKEDGYRLEFECEIEFTRDCVWVSHMDYEHADGSFTTRDWIISSVDIRVKKGQRTKVIGYVEFEKTERGWRAAAVIPR